MPTSENNQSNQRSVYSTGLSSVNWIGPQRFRGEDQRIAKALMRLKNSYVVANEHRVLLKTFFFEVIWNLSEDSM